MPGQVYQAYLDHLANSPHNPRFSLKGKKFNSQAQLEEIGRITRNARIGGLDISGNDLHIPGALSSLHQVLGGNTTLHTLTLDNNGLSTPEAVGAACLVPHKTKLHRLGLAYNNIKSPQTVLELHALAGSQIRILILANNPLSEPGCAEALLEVVLFNHNILEVILYNTGLTPDQRAIIQQATIRNDHFIPETLARVIEEDFCGTTTAHTVPNPVLSLIAEYSGISARDAVKIFPPACSKEPFYSCDEVLRAIKAVTKKQVDPVCSKGIMEYLRDTVELNKKGHISQHSKTPISCNEIRNTVTAMGYADKCETVLNVLRRVRAGQDNGQQRGWCAVS
jgi:hypothetical protein